MRSLAIYWKMTGNPWQNFQRRYVFTVIQIISSNKFGRNSSAWDTSCSVAILTSTRSDRKLRARFPAEQPQVATIQEVLILTSYMLSVITPFSTELLANREPKKPVPATGSYYSRKHQYLPVT